ncbi:MAG TPA: hypothetical protein VIW45_06640 [Vicinamibacterales bacterium]|jgi:hypothetical protein
MTQAQAPPAAAPVSLLAQARQAEAAYQFDVALDRLYALEIEQPRTADALTGRLQLARLLALAGDLPAAILQCQMLRDELPPNSLVRQQALDLATSLARRLRVRNGATGLFGAPELFAPRGLTALDEPTGLVAGSDGSILVVDQGADKLFRIAGDAASPIAGPGIQDPNAVAPLADGALAVGTKSGFVSLPAGKAVPATGTWGGKPHPLKRARAAATNSKGDLFLVDREYDGLLRCGAGATTCAVWSAPGKLRTVKVGPSDFVVTLDDKQQVVRVLDDGGRLVTTLGPMFGATKLEKIVDVAIDSAYGIYLLDGDLKRIEVAALRTQGDGRVSAEPVGSVTIPVEGDRALKNPTALTVTPSGVILVAGKSAPRLLRFR